MTHKKLWLTIAEAFGTPRNERTNTQNGLTGEGICWALYHISGLSSFKAFMDAFEKDWDANGNHQCYWLPTKTLKGDNLRCLFACFMAAMGKREYDAIWLKEASQWPL